MSIFDKMFDMFHFTKSNSKELFISRPDTHYVCYNMFNLDSILAAAMLVTVFSKHGDKVSCIPNTALLNKNMTTGMFHLVGVEMVSRKGDTGYRFNETPKEIYNSKIEIDDNGDTYTLSCLQQVANKYNISLEGLHLDLQEFYSPTIKKKQLVRLFINWTKAIQCLTGTMYYDKVGNYAENWVPIYDRFIHGVKNKLNNGYSIQEVEVTGSCFQRTAITCFNSDDTVWMLRLVRLAHPNYANIATSLNGNVIESNIFFDNLTVDSRLISARTM